MKILLWWKRHILIFIYSFVVMNIIHLAAYMFIALSIDISISDEGLMIYRGWILLVTLATHIYIADFIVHEQRTS